jgi:uncharacterized circularly permuted ATP-grasp superfamily protein/uncharacterized alpha-E superfamily protein
LNISNYTAVPLPGADYAPAPDIYDEMSQAAGCFRPHWEPYVAALSDLGPAEFARRWNTAREHIRENGVTYNVYGDPRGMDRPWNLDAIPLLIDAAEWRRIEAGLTQRARLLNTVLADLYGPQTLLRGGYLPPALLYANPGFWRPCHGIALPGQRHLSLLAMDLARSPDGQWWVISDRTQAPSGAGYALENRMVLAETFPDFFRELQVRRLASFFRAFRDDLLGMARCGKTKPLVVLLTPGPYNETFFEHSYLARYLGFVIAQGGDLTVRDSRVFLKTLEGLKQVHVILRRVDDGFCDPIELRSESFLGVAGLVEAVRAGNVAVANALGSGLIESPGFMPFLPGLSRRVLGEDLLLPSVATWWCGQPPALQYVRKNLDFLVIKPAFPASGREPVFGGHISGDERSELLARMQDRPWNFAGQEVVNLSTVPVWSGEAFSSRRVVLRAYVARSGDSWVVMPGGLARVSSSLDSPVVSMQRGGGSKDTWVLSNGPVDHFTLQRPKDQPVELIRGVTRDLPSRAADNLFWLGRYAERSENLARILRSILARLTAEGGPADKTVWNALLRTHETLGSEHSRLGEDEPQGHLDFRRDFEQEILSLIFEEKRPDSLHSNMNRAWRAAASVRDRLSADLLRVISQFSSLTRVESDSAWGYISAGDALVTLNHSIASLASQRGMEMENITRGPGWHFLSIGRRIERSMQLVRLFRGLVVPLHAETWPVLEILLEICDSAMTYRSRYFTVLQPAPALDLLMNDEANPRSLRFQIQDLLTHSASLARMLHAAEWPHARQTQVEKTALRLFNMDMSFFAQPDEAAGRAVFDDLLAALNLSLSVFSDAITHTWFSHAEVEQRA